MTSHDDIKAALEAATPGPWESITLGSEGFTVTGAPDTSAPGVRAMLRRRIARVGYQDWDTDSANAHLVAHAPKWLAELLAEVDALTARAEAAEATVRRVRRLAESWATQPTYGAYTAQQIEDGQILYITMDGGGPA